MRLTIDTPADFSFVETLNAHGWRRLLPFAVDDEAGTLERVEQLADGRVVLLTLSEEDRALVADVSEDAEPAEVSGLVRRMLQLDLTIAGFHAYAADHPKLRHVPRAVREGCFAPRPCGKTRSRSSARPTRPGHRPER